jgi:hypothetical protein
MSYSVNKIEALYYGMALTKNPAFATNQLNFAQRGEGISPKTRNSVAGGLYGILYAGRTYRAAFPHCLAFGT